MTDEPVATAAEWVEPETPFEKKRKRITYQCPKCDHIYVRIFAAEPKKDPPCPNRECVAIQRTAALQRQVENLTRMLEEQRAPATVGANVKVKAADFTAELTMQDNQLTNLNDRMRQGDIAAPKLPTPLQKAADGFFGGPAAGGMVGKSRQQKLQMNRIAQLGRRAIAGDFAAGAVAPGMVLPKSRPGPNVLGAYDPRRH